MSQKNRPSPPTPGSTTGSTPKLYATIRDQIIDGIRRGVYVPGALLPSRAQIEEHWGVSHSTSRRVLSELAELGWARAEGTRGYIVTAPASQSLPYSASNAPSLDPSDAALPAQSASHTDPAPDPAAQTAAPSYAPARPVHYVPLDENLPKRFTTVHRIQVATEPMPAHIAHAFHRPRAHIGAPITVRRRIIADSTGTIPVELRTSYTPDLDEDNPLTQAEPLTEPWPHALARHTGRTPATATTDIHTRRPTTHEATSLHIPAHGYVLVRATTYETSTGTAIDHTVSVWPADTTHITAEHHPITG